MKHPHWNHKSTPKPPPKDGFKSSYERKYADLLKTLVRDGQIVRWWHESMTLVVNSVEGDKRRYTPDFLLEFPDGKLRIVEVKGFAREDSILKFEVAAERWPCFEFVMVGWSKQGGWTIMKQYNMEATDERQDMD